MIEFEFEREAMRGEPMPTGLDFTDQKMFQAMSWLYKRYYAGYIKREQAKEEKGKLLYQYNKEKTQRKFEIELCRKQQEMFKKCEFASSEYSKNRNLKNADAIFEAIYNVKVDWSEKDV